MAQQSARVRIARLLFPPTACLRLTPTAGLFIGAVLVVGTTLGILRQTGTGALDTLYAEDGQIFLGEALRWPAGRTLISPYMGYFHLVPRLVAEVAAALPLASADTVMATAAAGLLTVLALVVYRASASHIGSPVVRGALAASMVLVPVAQEEALNNVANLHWFLIVSATWVLLWNPATRWELGIGATVVVLAGLSDPLTVLLLPLACLRLATVRNRRSQLLAGLLLAGVGGHLLAILVSGAERNQLSTDLNVLRTAGRYLVYVVGRGTFGMEMLPDPDSKRAVVLAGAALLLLGGLVLGLVVRTRRLLHPVPLFFLATSGAYYGATVTLSGISPPRYTVIPVLLLFSAVACVVDALLKSGSDTASRVLAAVVALMVGVVWTANYRVDNRRSDGRRWDTELTRARDVCGQSGQPSVRVPISPAGWWVDVPCQELVHAGPPRRG